jgi:hypothetical protein
MADMKELEGKNVAVIGNDFNLELSPDEQRFIFPLKAAIMKSRFEMVEQAKEFAFQFLGVDRENYSNSGIIESWLHGEDEKGLKSNEILLYIPPQAREMQDHNTPEFLRKMMSNVNFRFGWHLLTISKEMPDLIVGDSRLY